MCKLFSFFPMNHKYNRFVFYQAHTGKKNDLCACDDCNEETTFDMGQLNGKHTFTYRFCCISTRCRVHCSKKIIFSALSKRTLDIGEIFRL